jgi:hypothetical protein
VNGRTRSDPRDTCMRRRDRPALRTPRRPLR